MSVCKVPPKGWFCTRQAGHDGPCAAVPVPTWSEFWVAIIRFVECFVVAMALAIIVGEVFGR